MNHYVAIAVLLMSLTEPVLGGSGQAGVQPAQYCEHTGGCDCATRGQYQADDREDISCHSRPPQQGLPPRQSPTVQEAPGQPPQGSPMYAAPQSGVYVAPPQTGVLRGPVQGVGVEGLKITFPEFSLKLPSLELPSFFRSRRNAEMLLDRGVAPHMSATAPASYAPAAWAAPVATAAPGQMPAMQAMPMQFLPVQTVPMQAVPTLAPPVKMPPPQGLPQPPPDQPPALPPQYAPPGRSVPSSCTEDPSRLEAALLQRERELRALKEQMEGMKRAIEDLNRVKKASLEWRDVPPSGVARVLVDVDASPQELPFSEGRPLALTPSQHGVAYADGSTPSPSDGCRRLPRDGGRSSSLRVLPSPLIRMPPVDGQ
ncbi:MAG: hypothetical protein NTY19_07650 [Planctomycetota bacterium]|nr:hypothetical protein [Planctomycetota bacterium]